MKSLLDIFSLSRDELASFLVEFIKKAQGEGYSDAEIWLDLRALKYANRLRIWLDTSKDQAPSVIVCSNTTTVDWFDVLEGGKPLISEGKLYNGVFGNWESVRNPEEVDCVDDLTQTLYILNHGAQKGNPLPAYILFAGRSKPAESEDSDATLEATVEQVRNRFRKFVADSEKTPDNVCEFNNRNCMMIWNPKTEKPVTIPILGIIYEEQNNRFHVLELGKEDRAPVDAVGWLSNPANIAKMLGIGQKEFEKLRKDVFPDLLGKIWEKKMAADPAHAQLAHSYEVITRQAENIVMREEESSDSVWLRKFMRHKTKHGCVDSRQCGCNAKSLGAVQEQHNVLAATRVNVNNKERQIVPHLKCGYLTTVLSLHQLGEEMLQRIAEKRGKGKDWEERREILNARRFLAENMKRLFTGDYLGPLANADLFKHYMGVLGVEKKSNAYKDFEKIFLKNEQLTRAALRHAYENGVIEWDVNAPMTSVPVMKAAEAVEMMLLGFGFRREKRKEEKMENGEKKEETVWWVRKEGTAVQKIGSEHYMILVSEEFARWMHTGFMEEFKEGRIYQVPLKPENISEVMNTVREDKYIDRLSAGDVARLDAEGKFTVFDVLELVR
ncbi:MAG: hypothetical protein Q7T16_04880 [Candidatus Burarchaeum sp.]|nr:hypothetical protein [Candidatus Burarchaeum sp.]MDO8339964.1 hypothetical protein [Candidatus Burarchaeum sp.]